MPNSQNVLPQNLFQSHPFLPLQTREEKAQRLHRLLLDLVKDESEKELKSVYRQTADFFRDTVFGKSEKQIRAAIISTLEEYFDGTEYVALEIDNLVEETGIKEEKLQPVLNEMILKNEILIGRRRRHQEAGKHFSHLYKLKK